MKIHGTLTNKEFSSLGIKREEDVYHLPAWKLNNKFRGQIGGGEKYTCYPYCEVVAGRWKVIGIAVQEVYLDPFYPDEEVYGNVWAGLFMLSDEQSKQIIARQP